MKFFTSLFGGSEAPKQEETSPTTLNTPESTGPKLNAQGELAMSPELQKTVSQSSPTEAWGKVEIGKIYNAEAQIAEADAEVEAAKGGEETTPVNILERI